MGQPSRRIQAISTGGDQQAVDHRAPPAGVRVANEEPVLLADAAWPDRVLHQIRVDLVPTIFEIAHQRLPLAQSVPDRLAQRALR